MSSSIEAMISEVEYELGQRKRVYGRIVAANPSKAGECDMHMVRMIDVRDYLKAQKAKRDEYSPEEIAALAEGSKES